MEVLLIGNIHPEAEKLLKGHTNVKQITNGEFITQENFPETEAVMLRTFTNLGRKELDKLPRLRYVVSCSVGFNNLDVKALNERKVELVHCPGTNANSVAEHTLYMMLSLLRKDLQRPVAELQGKTVGIIGLGYIGKIVARKLLGFACKVIAFDVIEQDPEVLRELQVTMKSFAEVVGSADVLTVHVPLNKHTKGLISLDVFRQMKENSFFINTSRAEVIDEEGLLENYEKFRGIALDVYSEELKERLLGENILMTDHVAAQGEESFRKQCVEPVKAFLEKVD